MGEIKKYWKGIEDVTNDAAFVQSKENEFPEELPGALFSKEEDSSIHGSRRDFLKYLGFSVTAASIAACEAPVKKAVPYLLKPEEILPGVANWYATNYFDGHDYCDILVKTREGRPIKIEGNKLSPITHGGVNARVHASILSLYDSERLRNPLAEGKETTWDVIDNKLKGRLELLRAAGGNIRILSSTIISPSTKNVISAFTKKYPNTKHISYDAISYAGIIEANKRVFGKDYIPTYHLDKANLVVSFGADFLANWISPIQFSTQYAKKRKPNNKKEMLRHIQFESVLTVTGSNADLRVPIKPSEQKRLVLALYNHLAEMSGATSYSDSELKLEKELTLSVAKELWANREKSVVVSGSNDSNVQVIINEINKILSNYNTTIDINTPLYLKQGNDLDVVNLIEDMKKGNVDAVLFYNTNPIYSLPVSLQLKDALSKVNLKISFADRLDETASVCDFVCPTSHYLESWNDAQPTAGVFTLSQPVIAPLFATRSFQDSLLKWCNLEIDYYTFIQNYWKENIFRQQSKDTSFNSFWNKSLHDGICEIQVSTASNVTITGSFSLADTANRIINQPVNQGATELVFYEKTGIGNGIQANNPWLQELPDPITKVCWDNYLAVSVKEAEAKGFNTKQGQKEMADVVNITSEAGSLKVSVLAQPGQATETVGLALGYGRTNAGKVANNVGVNAFSLLPYIDGTFRYELFDVTVSASIAKYSLAATQTHHTMMGRNFVRETSLKEYSKDPTSGNIITAISVKEGDKHIKKPVEEISLWKQHEEAGVLWNLSIDLSACIGCGACVVSCQAENNVPVVGKDEVNRGREMHWLRIDRYYSSDAGENDLSGMEHPATNPEVVFQPVMCQHCTNAPCETVCPVIATSHSMDGLNQMTYNRCVGTRYCANNCPYKVRRFNWFQYSDNDKFDFNMNDDLGKMVLNPDVVVRSRGVMEKCSMCIQRIQEGKLNAKKENRGIIDGEILPACAQSCPTKAIVFGNVNDEKSEVAVLRKDPRTYELLDEIGIRPNVFYMTKIRNKS